MSRVLGFCLAVVMVPGAAFGIVVVDDSALFRRGDVNNDTVLDIADVAYIGDYLFNGGKAPPCLNQADVNDDGVVNISDQSYLSNYLYQGGPPPPAPGPVNSSCDPDPTEPFLGCEEYYCP